MNRCVPRSLLLVAAWAIIGGLVLPVANESAAAQHSEDTGIAGSVVFHLDSDDHMNQKLRQIARQVDDMPRVKVTVVMISGALRSVVEGATDDNGGLYSAQIEQLLAAGVRILACETTMISMNILEEDLSFGVETVPSGIVALTQMQLREQAAYQKL